MLNFSQQFVDVPLDTLTIAQSQLNIDHRTRTNPLAWNGQFSPQLVEVLLKTYAAAGDQIFDPFVGSGTVLIEAAMQGRAAQGTEINPAAYLLAKTYEMVNLPLASRTAVVTHLTQTLDAQFAPVALRLPATKPDPRLISKTLLNPVAASDGEHTQLLLRALFVLLNVGTTAPTEARLFNTWYKLRQHVLSLPHQLLPITVHWADARATLLPSRSVDLVITSPLISTSSITTSSTGHRSSTWAMTC